MTRGSSRLGRPSLRAGRHGHTPPADRETEKTAFNNIFFSIGIRVSRSLYFPYAAKVYITMIVLMVLLGIGKL